ncbi:phage tail protein [Burkholderia plantarii]|uniref:Phage-like tail fiber protein n=1 Tax=Burkholderia plantarii TaxID=41899 RepID=A0A0B6S1Z4_BURPL|nr:phage tail protein [Burkholderia plantarii]AJK46256.1 phage-like tail fiber protein [Burkholderia plantarii]
MSEPLNLKLTTVGQTAIFNAQNNGLDVTLTHIQFGTGNRVPDRKETALVSPKQLATIGAGQKISDSQIRMSAVFIGASNYEVCEIGIWAGEPGAPDSVLFAYCSQEAGRYAVMSAGVDFVFSYDMSIDEAVGNVVKIIVDPNGSAMIALMASHEAAANPHPQYATHVEVKTKVADVVGGAPGPLDTLGKLAGAVGGDPGFGRKVVLKAGDTMTGPLNVPIVRLTEGLPDDGAAPQIYNDPSKRNIVFRTGSAGAYRYSHINDEGMLTLPLRPTWGATPWDTDNLDPGALVAKAGGTMTGALYLPNVALNQGMRDGDAGSVVYNDPGKCNLVFRTGPAGAYNYGVIDEQGTLRLPTRPMWNATPWDTGNFDPNRKAAIESPAFVGSPSAPTPSFEDNSTRIATTAFVVRAISTADIGAIYFEARSRPRAGHLVLDGALLLRKDYPALWSYAQESGALVSDANWHDDNWGNFSDGDGATTFRVPELRGEHIRCWDNGRGVDSGRVCGSWQDSMNRSHSHGATASAAPDHVHTAWTDTQGSHYHVAKDPGHSHTVEMGRVGVVAVDYGQGWGPYNWDRQDIRYTSHTDTGIWIDWAGNHGHNVGIGGGGTHSHAVTVSADGGSESRPRNIALLATMRAY